MLTVWTKKDYEIEQDQKLSILERIKKRQIRERKLLLEPKFCVLKYIFVDVPNDEETGKKDI